MRIVRWMLGIAAGGVLLGLAAVDVVTVLVDPNRFKGRIERMARQATGQPFEIRGDLAIDWYPWLALQTGPAQLGNPPLLQWQSARVGAKLLPLIRGRLIVSKIRLDGLQVQLRRTADGRANWDSLTAGSRTGGTSTVPEIGGLEIRHGAFRYDDAQSNLRIALSDWRLDAGAWSPGKPIDAQTQFNIGAAKFSLSMNLASMEPLRARGALAVETTSLRTLLSNLAIGGPRPLDPSALGPFKLTTQWIANGAAVSVNPIQLRLDQTEFSGSLERSGPLWTFALKGDRIVLDRYIHIEDTDSEPFQLPVTQLRALPVQGVLSFNEAELAGARMKDVRLHAP